MKNKITIFKFIAPLALVLFVMLLVVGGISAESTGKQTEAATTTAMQRFIADRAANANSRSAKAPVQAISGLTPCTNGTAGTNPAYPCSNVDLLAFLPLSGMGSPSATNDIWGWDDPVTNIEWAIVGLTSGTAFVSLEDPEAPVFVGSLPTHTVNSIWRDVKVYANHAYIVSEADGHGMQVFDLTQLRTADPASFPITFSNTAHFGGFGKAHNIVINEDSGFAYAVGANTCSGGLQMININTPASPSNAGCFSADGYTHDAQCVMYDGPDTTHVGKEICFNSNEDTLTIVDVSTKSAPVQLEREGYAGSEYSHQGWLTEDHSYFLLDDELDEDENGHNTRTYVWDVRNLDQITLIGVHNAATAAIDHNLYIRDGLTYQSNYRAGVRILDNSDVASGNLSEVGFFDIYPSSNSASFEGSWSNYPYFDSGTLITTGIDEGLFVLRPDTFFAASTRLEACSGAIVSTTLRAGVLAPFANSTTLSQTGLPAGAVSFSVNPISLPGSSEMMINAPDLSGSYAFTVSGTDGSSTSSIGMTLNVLAGAPVAVATVSPATGTIGVGEAVTLQWTGNAAATSYFVEVASDPAFQNVIYSATEAGTSHTMDGLAATTAYYWRVTAQNACGGTPTATAAFVTFAGSADCAASFGPEDFESDNGGLSVVPSIGSTWSVRTTQANSGTRAWFGDDVGSVSDQRLDSPAIVLPAGATETRLYFETWYDLEDGSGGAYDGGILEISADNGSFTQLTDAQLLSVPYDDTVSGQYSSPIGGQRAWSGAQTTWREVAVNLDDYAGSTVKLRWRLATDSSVADVGWAIDDVRVESCDPVVVSADYSDLPSSYGAAWHTGDGTLRIGSAWDADSGFADGHDDPTDDVLVGAVTASTPTTVSFSVNGNGWVQAWFDWNGDNMFTSSEQVHNAAVTAGAVSFSVTPPADLAAGDIAYRIRLFDSSVDPDSTRAATAGVSGGEIEDGFTSNSSPTAVAVQQTIAAQSNPAVLLIVALLLATGLAFRLRRK